MQSNGPTDKLTYRWRNGQRDQIKTDNCTERQIKADRWTDRETKRQIGKL